jgi:hypothetical protein
LLIKFVFYMFFLPFVNILGSFILSIFVYVFILYFLVLIFVALLSLDEILIKVFSKFFYLLLLIHVIKKIIIFIDKRFLIECHVFIIGEFILSTLSINFNLFITFFFLDLFQNEPQLSKCQMSRFLHLLIFILALQRGIGEVCN